MTRRFLIALAALAAAFSAAAQDFPVKGKPIRVIVAFPPGGGADGQARAVSQRLGEILGTRWWWRTAPAPARCWRPAR